MVEMHIGNDKTDDGGINDEMAFGLYIHFGQTNSSKDDQRYVQSQDGIKNKMILVFF